MAYHLPAWQRSRAEMLHSGTLRSGRCNVLHCCSVPLDCRCRFHGRSRTSWARQPCESELTDCSVRKILIGNSRRLQ
eukprot:2232875-Pyramimonas_sp.AAC.1